MTVPVSKVIMRAVVAVVRSSNGLGSSSSSDVLLKLIFYNNKRQRVTTRTTRTTRTRTQAPVLKQTKSNTTTTWFLRLQGGWILEDEIEVSSEIECNPSSLRTSCGIETSPQNFRCHELGWDVRSSRSNMVSLIQTQHMFVSPSRGFKT